jgi:hypothetical protein
VPRPRALSASAFTLKSRQIRYIHVNRNCDELQDFLSAVAPFFAAYLVAAERLISSRRIHCEKKHKTTQQPLTPQVKLG